MLQLLLAYLGGLAVSFFIVGWIAVDEREHADLRYYGILALVWPLTAFAMLGAMCRGIWKSAKRRAR